MDPGSTQRRLSGTNRGAQTRAIAFAAYHCIFQQDSGGVIAAKKVDAGGEQPAS